MKLKLFVLPLALLTASTGFAAKSGNVLKYENVVDISEYQGSTYFSVMDSVVKPKLDEFAEKGFAIANGKNVVAALKKVDAKVASSATRAAGSAENLGKIADELSQQSEITFYDLPDAISKAGKVADRYGLATFISLVSGGGVAVKIDDLNTAYHVNYGTGNTDKDEMTGRSFGEGPTHLASDASDKMYLQTLEKYVRGGGDNISIFYQSLLEVLTNCDSSNYGKISPEGQTIATDFLAVYTAEQDRHLMAKLKSHHWDAALLEVTLLSAFHAGQKNIMVMYDGELTAKTKKQAPGCDTTERALQPASLTDYWQFSSSTDPASCKRSGINVTRKEFRRLGKDISDYERENNPDLVDRVEKHLKGVKTGGNLFAELTDFLINYKTPAQLDKKDLSLAADFTAFLMQAKKDANKASSVIIAKGKSSNQADDGSADN